jgi:PAS domain S-box-containing protein
MPYPTLLRDDDGRVVAAINMLVDISPRKTGDVESAQLAAIVSNSDDAIVSKTLDGIITSWNAGASRILGYSAEEMIGQPIIRIVPPELIDEERGILARLRKGERIDHFDTIRVAKNGSRVNVSLTVSPLRDGNGTIVGASKIARDISDRKQAESLQTLLFEELNHRVKNTLATIQAIASQSLRRAANPRDFVASFNGRVQALARAHDLLVQSKMKGAPISEILREQVMLENSTDLRIACAGPFVMLDARSAVQLALVVHELATNARKYGALSVAEGRLDIRWSMKVNAGPELRLEWSETAVPGVTAPTTHGFGSTLIQRTLEANGGDVSTSYRADGLTCEIRLPLPEAEFDRTEAVVTVPPEARNAAPMRASGDRQLLGKRILLVEDEPLVGMEIGSDLAAAGCEVVGPAASVKSARQLIGIGHLDAALLDANLAGDPVDEIAAELARRGIPFAFSTGYGRQALPASFRDAAVLTKPYNLDQLLSVLCGLIPQGGGVSDKVVPLKRHL